MRKPRTIYNDDKRTSNVRTYYKALIAHNTVRGKPKIASRKADFRVKKKKKVTSSARHNTITYATQIHKPKKNDELMLCCTYTNAAKHGVSTTDIHGSGSQLV